jgi:hypothetical protein
VLAIRSASALAGRLESEAQRVLKPVFQAADPDGMSAAAEKRTPYTGPRPGHQYRAGRYVPIESAAGSRTSSTAANAMNGLPNTRSRSEGRGYVLAITVGWLVTLGLLAVVVVVFTLKGLSFTTGVLAIAFWALALLTAIGDRRAAAACFGLAVLSTGAWLVAHFAI